MDIAGRFSSPGAALRCLGMLAAADRGHTARAATVGDGWWVLATVDLDLGRAAVHAAAGTAHVLVGGGYVRDRGFGPAPTDATSSAIDPGTLTDITLLDLVRAAGLHPAPAGPLTDVVVVAPGTDTATIVRRCLELGLDTTYRPVRLRPLFTAAEAPNGASPDNSTLIEIGIRAAAAASPIPASLLTALSRRPLTVVCRAAAVERPLLIQHRMATAVPDHQLAALTDQPWLLADPGFGCWQREPLGDPAPAAALVHLGTGLPLHDQHPAGDLTATTTIPVRVVTARTGSHPIDAVLLADADLTNLALLLEHHPLADIAVVVPGHDHHLLLAAGGILDDLPIGRPLTCTGPGPLYLPLGHRLSPRLPAAARRQLFDPDEHHAVVALPDRAHRFLLDQRRPVWTLWVGEAPRIDTQLPARSRDILADLAAREPQPARPPARTRWWQRSAPPPAPRDWRDEALAAELSGDLVRAAELHRSNNEPLRAAHLFERAAEQSGS